MTGGGGFAEHLFFATIFGLNFHKRAITELKRIMDRSYLT